MRTTGFTRRQFLWASSAAIVLGPAASGSAADRLQSPGQRPNVLFINTDQQRTDTLRCYGNTHVQTPHLDSLAASGALFASCYVTQPVCSPCRSSMVTGLFPNATSVVENNIPLPPDLFAWPRALHDAGYRTAYFGKWHLGVEPVPDYFDVWRGFHTGWKHFIEEEPFFAAPGESDSAFRERIAGDPPVVAEGKSVIGRYRPDVETDSALEFIGENQSRPFACWLSFYPPHTPKEAPEENIALYRDDIQPEEQAIYHAMVNRLDWNVGRVLTRLEELGLREKTLIVFTSDHGENFPYRWNDHHKRLCYDQSAHVPLLISMPGQVQQGVRISSVVSIADLCPTILDVCRMDSPAGLHGDSLKPLLTGDASGWRDDAFIQNSPYKGSGKEGGGEEKPGKDPNMRERCLVTREWKLILNTSRPPELYDRRSTEPDTHNMFGQEETKAATRMLAKRMREWSEKTGDGMARQLVDQWETEWQ
ncbi:MAG: sulfatase-like hydrolase/transferase [Candidatus Hydrogenedentes bacterium]|nr:sulfatase-like hydrolase/transferase [Candidatus Hydrogenedentota bacterium]